MAQAKLLFQSLRAVDALGVQTIYARMPSRDGMGLAKMCIRDRDEEDWE